MSVSDVEEKLIYSNNYNVLASFDESGMGCFAGDVYVGAVIFPQNINYKLLMPGLNDSKKKTHEQRVILYDQIINSVLDYAVCSASVKEIDELNIYWARFLAARRCLDALKIKPDFIIIDGNKTIPDITIPQKAIVKGDAKCFSIAAASILAKIERDRHIDELAKLVHMDYDWINNKSYYSEQQVEAIKKHGKTQWHREKYVRKYLIK